LALFRLVSLSHISTLFPYTTLFRSVFVIGNFPDTCTFEGHGRVLFYVKEVRALQVVVALFHARVDRGRLYGQLYFCVAEVLFGGFNGDAIVVKISRYVSNAQVGDGESEL